MVVLLSIHCIIGFLVLSIEANLLNFRGQEKWSWEDRENCEEQSHFYENRCYFRVVRNRPIKLEVIHEDPLIVLYHDFLTKDETTQTKEMIEELNFQEAEVFDENRKEFVLDNGRVANRSWITQNDNRIAIKIVQLIEYSTGLNPFYAEALQLFRYHPGGHYAPHYDYIPENNDDLMNLRMGNRISTFLLVIKQAEVGGASTIFPKLGIRIRPKPGDALVWFNMDINDEMALDTLHGACPIGIGEKIVLSLWIRVNGQLFRAKCINKKQHYTLKSLGWKV